jgi:hypothetical protein
MSLLQAFSSLFEGIHVGCTRGLCQLFKALMPLMHGVHVAYARRSCGFCRLTQQGFGYWPACLLHLWPTAAAAAAAAAQPANKAPQQQQQCQAVRPMVGKTQTAAAVLQQQLLQLVTRRHPYWMD